VISTATIEEACDLVTDGTHYTPKNIGRGIPFLTVKDVTDDALDFIGCSFISDNDFRLAKAGNSAPQRGDILFSKDGTVGKVHVVSTDKPFAVLSSLAILRPKPDLVDPKYFGFVLRSPRVLDDALKRKTGSAIRRVILSDLKSVRVPLPPLPEQRQIAAILDRTDALRAKRRAALAQLDTLTQSIFLDTFGSVRDNPNGWQVVALTDVCSPKQWPTISTSDLTPSGFPVYGANGHIGFYSDFNHEHSTVLITCRGATCGTINVSPPRCYVTGNAMSLDDPDPKRICIAYLEHVLRARGLADAISGTAQPQITRQGLLPVRFPLPPIDLQLQFGSCRESG